MPPGDICEESMVPESKQLRAQVRKTVNQDAHSRVRSLELGVNVQSVGSHDSVVGEKEF